MSLREKTFKATELYLSAFEDHELIDLNMYEFIISEVEKGLLEATLIRCSDNQAWAASLLGISRNTLRKKIDSLQINQEKTNKPKRRGKKDKLI